MTKDSAASGKTLIAALKRIGCEEIRVKGRHRFHKHPDGRTTVVPVHSNETLGPGLLARNFVMSSSQDLNGKIFYDELNDFSAVSLSRRHEPDAAGAVLVVVPVHESRHPQACFVLAAEGPLEVVRTVLDRAEPPLREGVVVADSRP